MSSSLHDAKASADLARLFYDFLPGSGGRSWKGYVTFETVAHQAGVGEFWTGGSKEPTLARLLEQTLKHSRHRFEDLVLTIVSEGIKYRRSKNNEVREAEILAVSRLTRENAKGRVLSALQHGPLSNAQIREITQMNREQIKWLMRNLAEEGAVVMTGSKRSSRWNAAPPRANGDSP